MKLKHDPEMLMDRLKNNEEIWFFIYEPTFHSGVGKPNRDVVSTQVGDIIFNGRKTTIKVMGKKGKPISKSYRGVSQDYKGEPIDFYTDYESCNLAYQEKVNNHLQKLEREMERELEWRKQEIEVVKSKLTGSHRLP